MSFDNTANDLRRFAASWRAQAAIVAADPARYAGRELDDRRDAYRDELHAAARSGRRVELGPRPEDRSALTVEDCLREAERYEAAAERLTAG